MSKKFWSKLALFVLHDGICLSFHNKATVHASALHCVLWQNLDKDSFGMFYENYCWAAIPDPIWTTNVPYERKINMLSSTDNNFMIFLFNFERFRIKSLCPFFLLTLYNLFPLLFFNAGFAQPYPSRQLTGGRGAGQDGLSLASFCPFFSSLISAFSSLTVSFIRLSSYPVKIYVGRLQCHSWFHPTYCSKVKTSPHIHVYY